MIFDAILTSARPDFGGGARGSFPPRLVNIGQKDSHQMRSLIFHVSWPRSLIFHVSWPSLSEVSGSTTEIQLCQNTDFLGEEWSYVAQNFFYETVFC